MFKKSSSGYPTSNRGSNDRGACPDITPTTEGSNALDIRPDWRTNPAMRVRRPSRTQETSALHRGRALLHMQATFATSQSTWLKAVDEWINDLQLRADGRENRRRIARTIGFNADWKTLTTNTLTWATIAERTGITKRSVARHLEALHEAGWIGRIAAGRSAAAKRAAGWTTTDAFLNDAPVYALTTPIEELPVDINVTPPTLRGYKEFPARAHEGTSQIEAASRHPSVEAATGRAPATPADRKATAWKPHVPTTSKDERIRAAATWARLVPALRKLSDRHLASIARPFLVAGWTVRDLIHACDHRPDGRAQGQFVESRWVAYSGADGIPRARLGHWLKWRLDFWTTQAGAIEESITQQNQRKAGARKIERSARLRADEEERAANRAAMNTAEGQTAKLLCLAQFRSRARERKLGRR